MGLEGTLRSVKRFLKGATLASSIYLSGCATTLSEFTEGEGLTLIGALIGESDDASVRKLAPYVSLLGQMRYQKEVVRGGRTQVNINQQEQAQNNQDNIVYSGNKGTPAEGYVWTNPENQDDFGTKRIFSSGFVFKWVDYNRDGGLDVGELEMKTKFRQNESIALALMYSAEGPISQNMKIYSPEGKIVREWNVDSFRRNITETQYLYRISGGEREQFEVIEIPSEWTGVWEENRNSGMTNLLNNDIVKWLFWHGEGEYSAVWRVDGKIMDSIAFDLIY